MKMSNFRAYISWIILSIYLTHTALAHLDYTGFSQSLYDYSKSNQYGNTGYAPSSSYSTDLQLEALGKLLYQLASSVTPSPPSQYPASYPVTSSDARIGYGFPATSSGYGAKSQGYGHQTGYSHQTGYGHQQQGYQQGGYQQAQPSYQQTSYKPVQKPKKEKIFVPIVVRKKKKKKRKTIAVYKGFYIEGGTQIFGKFKKIQDCKKACEITPNCFAADYNPWLKKCYIHTNVTACEEMRTHPKLIHFKKVPCDLVETPRGLITLGAQIFGGLEQKGVKSLQDCLKKCATAGSGIAPSHIPAELSGQICFGIDYDFGSHKCYFHTNSALCPELVPTIPTPVQLVENPSNINILLCPVLSITA